MTSTVTCCVLVSANQLAHTQHRPSHNTNTSLQNSYVVRWEGAVGYCGEDVGGTEVIMRNEVNGRNIRLQCTGNRTSIPLVTLEPF